MPDHSPINSDRSRRRIVAGLFVLAPAAIVWLWLPAHGDMNNKPPSS